MDGTSTGWGLVETRLPPCPDVLLQAPLGMSRLRLFSNRYAGNEQLWVPMAMTLKPHPLVGKRSLSLQPEYRPPASAKDAAARHGLRKPLSAKPAILHTSGGLSDF